jgi:hypothetical protein
VARWRNERAEPREGAERLGTRIYTLPPLQISVGMARRSGEPMDACAPSACVGRQPCVRGDTSEASPLALRVVIGSWPRRFGSWS